MICRGGSAASEEYMDKWMDMNCLEKCCLRLVSNQHRSWQRAQSVHSGLHLQAIDEHVEREESPHDMLERGVTLETHAEVLCTHQCWFSCTQHTPDC